MLDGLNYNVHIFPLNIDKKNDTSVILTIIIFTGALITHLALHWRTILIFASCNDDTDDNFDLRIM